MIIIMAAFDNNPNLSAIKTENKNGFRQLSNDNLNQCIKQESGILSQLKLLYLY
jgi:hypothetical protein